jgi:hypothetical protein
MKKSKVLAIFFLILAMALTTCTKKPTSITIPYKEPVCFELFKVYLDTELPPNYVKAVQDAWNNELRYDGIIKRHTWWIGDYTVFVYYHTYITGILHTSYSEVIFFTTTQPKKCIERIHSTITIFKADFLETMTILSKIKTYVYINNYDPVKDEQEAKNIMINYLDEYIEKYKEVSYDGSLIDNLKKSLIDENYIWDWVDHFVYYKSPSDFGGGIIINKLTSKLDFLGSSVFFGTGRRYFPLD